jgi:hypothetical protein
VRRSRVRERNGVLGRITLGEVGGAAGVFGVLRYRRVRANLSEAE